MLRPFVQGLAPTVIIINFHLQVQVSTSTSNLKNT